MYRDHLFKALIIIFAVLTCFFTPILLLKIFYGNHFTFVFGAMFSKVFVYAKYGYYGYVYVSKAKHSSAMLGVYFYLVTFLFLASLSFLLIKFLLKDDNQNVKDYCVTGNKKKRFTLDILDDKKRNGN